MIEIQPYIEIVKIPGGEAPFPVRKSWVGIKLPILREHYDGKSVNPISCDIEGILSHTRIGFRAVWFVDYKTAINILSQYDNNASLWFLKNVFHLENLAFLSNEAMLVE